MQAFFIFLMCLLMNFASVQSEEVVQESVPPVVGQTKDTNESTNSEKPPEQTLPHSHYGNFLTTSPTNKSRIDNKGESQANGDTEAGKWTDPTTISDFFVAVFTGLLTWIAYKQNQFTKSIQRAYINVSPCPPGLRFDKDHIVILEIKNFGDTPAEITDIWVQWKTILPEKPDYPKTGHCTFPRTFLVKTEWFFHDEPKPEHIDMAKVKKGEIKCFLYGYVDYRDRFSQRHRVGFARVYDPKRDNWNEYDGREAFEKRSNLVFVSQDRYSYDHLRKKDEGNDWKA